MRHLQSIRILAISAALSAIAVTPASAGLAGNTYTNSGAPTTSWPATTSITGSAIRYQSSADPTNGTIAQGYPPGDGSNTGAILAEIVTPTTTFTLDTISVSLAGAATNPTGYSLHLFSLASASSMPDLANSSSAFYNPGTDLLGGGSGLPFAVGGFSSTSLINFTLNNTGTTDKVTLNANTSYAVEFWNNAPTFDVNSLTWMRSAIADPGGQAFANKNTGSASRNTITANGLAGGAPRVFQIALYGAVAAAGVTGDYNNNGVVDAADYVVWRKNLGQSVTIPNDPTPGTVTQSDYDYWAAHFSATSGAGAGLSRGGAVPEPSTILLAVVGMIGVGAFRRRSVG
jgi:PEP-CTERM motif